MATDIDKELYTKRLQPYQDEIKAILAREKTMGKMIKKDDSGSGYKRLVLAEDMIYLATLYLAKQRLSIKILKRKNEDSLNEARKALYKAIIQLEEIVTDYVDVPFSDYAEQVSHIKNLTPKQRFYLMRKLGLAINLVTNAYGENTKWKWSFVELLARYATISKNILDLKDVTENGLNPQSPDYEVAILHLRLTKKLLQKAADQYREKYELATSSGTSEDFRRAINYLKALRRLHLILNERNEAEEVKRKAEIWHDKMEKDSKKRRADRQGR
ncbi:MAG: hypothetical protein CR988_05040 [Treponema sp.]|nr:MAG: hypothetical protein CR988_05040 [Treponema sp.]